MTTAPPPLPPPPATPTTRAGTDRNDDTTKPLETLISQTANKDSSSSVNATYPPAPPERSTCTMQALELDQDDDDDVLEEAEFEAENKPSLSAHQKRHYHRLGRHNDHDNHNHHHHNNDMQGLLSDHDDNDNDNDERNGTHIIHSNNTTGGAMCSRVGNMTIFVPHVWLARTKGWGMIGPHWLGPLTIAVLVVAASLYFITKSVTEIGYLTAATCTLFAILTLYHLLNTALRDPGIVLLQPTTMTSSSSSSSSPDHNHNRERAQHRWCDICELFQPPDGVHCPDCNVCVAGFDHHCVWMGTCVGRNNFKQFIRFNLCWLAYLIYAIVWVTFLGPLFVTHTNAGSNGNNNNSPAANHRQASVAMGTTIRSNGSWNRPTTMMMVNHHGNHPSLRHVPAKNEWRMQA